MGSNGQYHFEFLGFPKKFPRMFNNSSHLIAVYTVFCLLRSMRRELCLEAMLEYMDEYVQTVEKGSPLLKESVLKALSKINIKKIYKDAML